jgi:hypothetical protein
MDQINYEELAKEVIRQQETQKQEQTPQNHKEAVISVLRERTAIHQQLPIQQAPGSQQTTKTINATPNQKETNLPKYAQSASPEAKQEVENLITLTLQKGLMHGVEQAAKADPFVIDMYHDALAEHIVAQMKEKGLI